MCMSFLYHLMKIAGSRRVGRFNLLIIMGLLANVFVVKINQTLPYYKWENAEQNNSTSIVTLTR